MGLRQNTVGKREDFAGSYGRSDFATVLTGFSEFLPGPLEDDDSAVTDGRYVAYDKGGNIIWYFDRMATRGSIEIDASFRFPLASFCP